MVVTIVIVKSMVIAVVIVIVVVIVMVIVVIGSYWIWSLVKTSSNHTQSKGQKPSTRVAFYKRHLYCGQVTTKTSTMITMLTNTTMMLMRLTMVLVAGRADVDYDNHVDQYHDDVDEVDHMLGCRGC